MSRHSKTSVAIAALPWILILGGLVVFLVGLMWGDITESDTVNGAMVVGGAGIMIAGFAVSCLTEQEDTAPTPFLREMNTETPL